MKIQSRSAVATFLFTVIVCFSNLAVAASTRVDANGNVLAESDVAGASADQEAELAKELQKPGRESDQRSFPE